MSKATLEATAPTGAELVKLKREILARYEDEVERLKRMLANAEYETARAGVELDAATAVLSAQAGVP